MADERQPTPLKEKIKHLLNEALILITAAEVLVGFQFRSVFESGFDRLPPAVQYLKLGGLGLLLGALALLIAPASYHRIVTNGEDTEDVHSVSSVMLAAALVFFALGLTAEVYIAFDKVGGFVLGLVAGAAAGVLGLSLWFGIELLDRQRRVDGGGMPLKGKPAAEPDEQAKLKDKVEHVLDEARMVIPGAQALLGFQFASMLVDGFDKIPESSKYVHLGSLALIALSVMLLMTPAAYHRLVEHGEDSAHFHRFATGVLTGAMVPLALGIAGDVYVVCEKVLKSSGSATLAAILTALAFFGLWFGFTYYRRMQRRADAAAE